MSANSTNQDLPDLDQIALEYGQMVSAICTRMIQNPDIAEEAAQETWLEIIRSIIVFKADQKYLHGFTRLHAWWFFAIRKKSDNTQQSF